MCLLLPTGLGTSIKPFDADSKREYVNQLFNIDIPLPGKEGRRKMFDINLKELKISEKIDW